MRRLYVKNIFQIKKREEKEREREREKGGKKDYRIDFMRKRSTAREMKMALATAPFLGERERQIGRRW